MERDNAISHGASRFLQERLRDASDAYETVYCKNCGIIATNVVKDEAAYKCTMCDDNNFGRVTIPYVFKYLGHLLNGMNMFMRFKLYTQDEYLNLRNKQSNAADPGIVADDLLVEEQEEEEEDIFNTREGFGQTEVEEVEEAYDEE